jgi:hypothetical protein
MKPPDDAHPAAEHAALRAFLQSKHGLTPAQCDAAVDTAPNGKSRRQTEQRLTTWAKTLPKGT